MPNSKWDVAPAGFTGMSVSQVAQINPNVLVPLLSSQNPQQSRQARRLYVGNVPANVTEEELAEFFNAAMITAKASKKAGDPVFAVQINREKKLCLY